MSKKMKYLFFLMYVFWVLPISGEDWKNPDYMPYIAEHFTVKTGLPHFDMNAVAQDRMGFLYFGTWGKGLYRYDGYTWEQFTRENAGLSDDRIRYLTYDNKDSLYVVHMAGGISRFNITTGKVQQVVDISKFQVYLTRALFREDGKLYIASAWKGLFIYDTIQGELRQINLAARKGHSYDNDWNILKALYFDAKGRLLAGAAGGVVVIENEEITGHIPYEDNRSEPIWGIYQMTDGTVVVSSENSIGILDESKGQIVSYPIELFSRMASRKSASSASFRLDSEGRYLYCTRNGMAVYDPRTGRTTGLTQENDMLVHNYINNIFIDREKNIWLTTQGGITKLRLNPFKNIQIVEGMPIINSNIIDNRFHSIRMSEGGVWLYFLDKHKIVELSGERYLSYDLTKILSTGEQVKRVSRENGKLQFEILQELKFYVQKNGVFKTRKEGSFTSRSLEWEGFQYISWFSSELGHGILKGNKDTKEEVSWIIPGSPSPLATSRRRLYPLKRGELLLQTQSERI